MSRGFIIGLGGGGKAFAWITVTYPAGSTCTCTNGTKTLTAESTGGQWVFGVPSTGTWTVNCTDGSDSDSQSVSITAKNQMETVELAYAYYLIQNGQRKVQFSTLGAATLTESGGYVVMSANSTGSCYAQISDVSRYSTLTIKYNYLAAAQGMFMGVSRSVEDEEFLAEAVLQETTSEAKTAMLDVSSYSGQLLCGVWTALGGTIYITEMVLT